MKYLLIILAFILPSCADLFGANPTVTLTLLAEARGESSEGLRAVAQVILNRSIKRGISPAEVCLQPKQFSCWNSGISPSIMDESEAKTNEAEALAMAIELGWRVHPTDADHYFAHDLINPPYWAKGRKWEIIGSHAFMKINP